MYLTRVGTKTPRLGYIGYKGCQVVDPAPQTDEKDAGRVGIFDISARMDRVCDESWLVSAHPHSWVYGMKPSKLTVAGISFSVMAASFLRFVSLGQVILSDDQPPKK
jgi:hypothetical protein